MRRGVILGAMGLAAALSAASIPFERLAQVAMPVWQLRLLATIQPLVLILAAVAIGSLLAPRVALGAPLIDALRTGSGARAVLRRQLPAALAVAVAVALLLIVYGLTVVRTLVEGAGEALAGFSMPLATKLLYGGIGEELLTRWGLMTLFVWIGWRLGGRPAEPGQATVIVAIILSALLFAAGHLPLLALLAPDAPASMIVAVMAGNALPGILFGWLYWRRGIEAAMIAHAGAHLLSHGVVA